MRFSNGKVAFNMGKGCESKDHIGGNIAIPWDRLKEKLEPTIDPSLVKR